MSNIRNNKILLTFIILGAFFAVAGVVLAAIPAGDEEIVGDFHINGGDLHLGTGLAITTISGNGTGIGIGTTNPTRILSIQGNSAFEIFDSGGVRRFTIDLTSNQPIISASNGVPLRFGIGGSEIMRVDENNNVGIGDTDPDATLEIIDAGGDIFMISSVAGNDGDFMIVDTSGNVGIGTSTPNTKLTITGNEDGQFASILRIDRTSASPANFDQIDFFYSHENDSSQQIDILRIRTGMDDITAGTEDSTFSVANMRAGTLTEVFRVDEDGQFGIGEIDPDFRLEIGSTFDKGYFGVSSDVTENGDVFVIRGTGNIGIGTANPGFLLHASTTDGTIALFESFASAASIVVRNGVGDMRLNFQTHTANLFNLGVDVSDSNKFKISTDSGGALDTSTALTIDTSGNVGIGTTTPNEILQLASTANTRLMLTDTDYYTDGKHWWIESNNGRFSIGTTDDNLSDESTRLVIDSDGRVGIGMTSPARTLDINGTMRIEPTASAPATPSLGDVYVDSDSNEFCFYTGSAWVGLAGGGTCN